MRTTKVRRILLVALLLPLFAQAQEPIGVVLATKGQVTARAANGSVRPLSRRDPIYARDVLVTDADGYGQLKMTDDAMIALAADTEFMFDRYAFDGNPATQDAAVMTLTRGCFMTISGTVGGVPGDEHRIDTPVATIRIRGTVHAGAFDGEVLYTANYEGATTVVNEQGSVDLGIGGNYDFSRTVAGVAPEGLLAPPIEHIKCGMQAAITATRGGSSPPTRLDFENSVINPSAAP